MVRNINSFRGQISKVKLDIATHLEDFENSIQPIKENTNDSVEKTDEFNESEEDFEDDFDDEEFDESEETEDKEAM